MNVIAAKATTATVADYLELTKPRITLMVLFTTFAGSCLASPGTIHVALLFHTLLGTAFVACGASVLNMVLEADADSRMRRTLNRPIPSGKIPVFYALSCGALLSIVGLFHLLILVNPLTSFLAALTEALYLFAYTPLKVKTWLCTIVGAVPGAIPPVMGWTAVRSAIDIEACWLFVILFLWQLPHFFAIAWIYREDYASGGFAVLPVLDPKGARTARQIILFTAALLIVSLLPPQRLGGTYTLGALVLGSLLFVLSVRFANARSAPSARQLILASVFYLPLIMSLMLFSTTR